VPGNGYVSQRFGIYPDLTVLTKDHSLVDPKSSKTAPPVYNLLEYDGQLDDFDIYFGAS
jgi:hypothetical protein